MEEDFIGEFEVMDLSELKEERFMVAISNGKREEYGFLCSSLIGPFSFMEMVENVSAIYSKEALHAKAMICSLELGKHPKFLNMNTIDYIEANVDKIVVEDTFGEMDTNYTCKAGFN